MQAVILAGGLGTRLRPLTEQVPKPMVEVAGKPFLEHQMILLKKNGVDDIVLLTGYLSEQIESYFGDGSGFGVRIRYSREPESLGTGGALKNAAEYLSDVFFLLNGDTILDVEYSGILKRLKALSVVGVLAAYDNSVFVSEGNVSVDKEGIISGYNKEGGEDMRYVDAGVSAYSKKITGYFPRKDKFSLEEDVYPKLISQRNLAAYPTSTRFYDMGTPERLEAVEGVFK